MENRETKLLAIRPEIFDTKISPNMSEDEQFQNKTIRPIAKLQNDLIIEVFKNYIQKTKNTFYTLTIDERILFIKNAIQKDTKFRNSLKGIIIGQFTVNEYLIYIKNSSSLNKRMMNLVKEKIQFNIQLLDQQNYSR